MIDPQLLSGAVLAFVGDAYYELEIRHYLINKGITSLHKLHNQCVKYVSSTAQHFITTKIFANWNFILKTRFYAFKNTY